MQTYNKITDETISIRNAETDEIITNIIFNKVYDEDNERTLYLIESAGTQENYQRQGYYKAALQYFAESNFDSESFFCSIGRSYSAAMFWSKHLGLSAEETEAEVEKEEQGRALIIDAELDLVSNEPNDELLKLFF